MIFYRILDQVLSGSSQIAVLRAMQDSKIGLSGREISRLAGISPKACLQALTNLENLSIVFRQRGGRDHFFSLNREHLLVKEGILTLLNIERDYLKLLSKKIIRNTSKHSESIILFGSVARKEESIESDTDICFVYSGTSHREMISNKIEELSSSIKRQYGATISPFFISLKGFKRKAKLNQPPVNEILKDGIVLYGKSIRVLANG
jgi:predicted nucleotidyltransferase